MLALLERIFGRIAPAAPDEGAPAPTAPPEVLCAPGAAPLAIAPLVQTHLDLPRFDWAPIKHWLDTQVGTQERAAAWVDAERAWLAHLRAALGERYRIDESAHALLLSPLGDGQVRATLDFIERARRRILIVLDGIAADMEYGKEIVLVFADEDAYYRYVTAYYPEGAVVATSGGMHIASGCSHYAIVLKEMRELERVIAHEMTHGAIEHLPIPRWLHEGIAQNTEARIAGTSGPEGLYEPIKRHHRHTAFWNAETIQGFWSGEAFDTPGESRELSYDLARIATEQLAKDWHGFRAFANAASIDDAGAAAALDTLGLDLGALAAALVEAADASGWSPEPACWNVEASTLADAA